MYSQHSSVFYEMTNYNSHYFIGDPYILYIREPKHRKVDNLTSSASCSTRLNLGPDPGLSDSKTRGKDTAVELQTSGLTGKSRTELGFQGLSSMPERERQQAWPPMLGLASLGN